MSLSAQRSAPDRILRSPFLVALCAAAAAASARAGSTALVSRNDAGVQGNNSSSHPAIAASGSHVVFASAATNLVSPDANFGTPDVYRKSLSTGETIRVSVSTGGAQANFGAERPDVSADGRHVVFQSWSYNLVPDDHNDEYDVFLRDVVAGTTERVSLTASGGEPNGPSEQAAISGDGDVVAFQSWASNLVPGDTNQAFDVFVRIRSKGVTRRVSVSSAGAQANGQSYTPAVSLDGRYVAFYSSAPNLVPGDGNGEADAFVHDLATGATERVSTAPDGTEANGDSFSPELSADGRFVSFASRASNLVPGDTNGTYDVFVKDRATGLVDRVSVATGGGQADFQSTWSALSANGRFVAFESYASNLAPSDVNGLEDVFVHDRATGITVQVSVSSAGQGGNLPTHHPDLTANGRLVAYDGEANNLVPGDTNHLYDVFVHRVSF